MKRSTFLILPALLLMLAVPATASAQEDMGTWFTVFSAHVPISNQQAYEDGIRELVAAFEAADIQDVSWVAISSSEFGYSYVIPGDGPSEYLAGGEDFNAAMAAGGADAGAAMQSVSTLASSREMAFITLRSDLSHMPDDVPLSADAPYRHYTEILVHPGHEEEFEAAAKKWAEAYGERGVEAGWRLLEFHTGPDLPRYLVVESAESETAFYMRRDKVNETLADDLDRLRAGTGPTMKSVKNYGGMVRPDMSYPSSGGDTD